MNISRLILGELNTNVYLLELKDSIWVIDPASDAELILAASEKINKRISYVLLTHGHFDHCNAARALQQVGAKVLMSETDFDMIERGYDLAKFLDVKFNDFVPDDFVSEGEIMLDNIKVNVISTPGHTAGSITYIIDGNIFCGDTLFFLGIGRSDLPTGNKRELTNSIRKLYLYDGDVYPGHGEKTTIRFERANNPYVKA